MNRFHNGDGPQWGRRGGPELASCHDRPGPRGQSRVSGL